MSGPSALVPVAATLSVIAHKYGLEAKLLEYRLQRRWSEIVGDQIATHTRPDAIRFRKLYVVVGNSVWLQQLMFLKPSLIEKINASAGSEVISDIVLRVGETDGQRPQTLSQDPHSKNKEPTELAPTPESLAEAAAHTHAVSDLELRARFATVMARALNVGVGRRRSD